MISGTSVSMQALAAVMVEALYAMNTDSIEKKRMLSVFLQDCITTRKEISLVRENESRRRKAQSVENDGALVVQWPDGSLEHVNSGEVSVGGMYGYA